jgi:hypothetical protein
MVYTLPTEENSKFYIPLHKVFGGMEYGKGIMFKVGDTQYRSS